MECEASDPSSCYESTFHCNSESADIALQNLDYAWRCSGDGLYDSCCPLYDNQVFCSTAHCVVDCTSMDCSEGLIDGSYAIVETLYAH